MAKITVKFPVLSFRKQAVETPPSKGQIVKRALSTQRGRLTGRLTKRDPQSGRIASTSTRASRFPGMARLSRRNPEAARRLDQAAAASSAPSSRSRYAALGLLGLIGAGAGAVASRRTTGESRAELARRTGGYALIVVRQTGVGGRSLGNRARRGATAARSRVARRRKEDVDPEAVTDRVRTELGEDQTLRHLPRIDVDTEPAGIVYLRGTVPGETERLLAEEIARRQRGVMRVVNELQVRTSGNARNPGEETGMSYGENTNPDVQGLPVEGMDDDAARVQLHEEKLQAQKVQREAGAVRVNKDVVEEERTLDVPVTRERVQVRSVVPTGGEVDASQAFQQQTIEVPVTHEDVRVSKDVRVAEELEIGKTPVTEAKSAADTVRREVADVDRAGNLDATGDAGSESGGRKKKR